MSAEWIPTMVWSPFIAAAILLFFPKAKSNFAAFIAIGAMGVSFLIGLGLLNFIPTNSLSIHSGEWLAAGTQSVVYSWIWDPLSSSMALMVSFVAMLIFIFSAGYMAEDIDFNRFFTYLSLFAGGMLGLVLSNSLLQMFMFWEIVGLASFLLIGFWHHKPSAAAAAKKAFLTTRLGDLGFFIGLLWWYHLSGTIEFYNKGSGILEMACLEEIRTLAGGWMGLSVAGTIGLLLFCGAIGKSGQFPLHVWLPDAMEGPTPVSALIHAATMVAAGVFMVARIYPLMALDSGLLQVITFIGLLTALIGACSAVAQFDIKRILAYSTVSQLGLMMAGIGLGGVTAGMFHLLTHAFFKALLFLGAGSIIHGCGGEQDIRKMGGLRKHLPVTCLTYGIAFAALCGVPGFAGFFSKELILGVAHEKSLCAFTIIAGVSFLTAFYMTRQWMLVFMGNYRGNAEEGAHSHEPHESPWSMLLPLTLLSVFALFGGWLANSHIHGWFGEKPEGHASWIVPTIGIGVALGGMLLGFLVYRNPSASVEPVQKVSNRLFDVLSNAFYFDAIYAQTVGKLFAGFTFFAQLMEVVFQCVIFYIKYLAEALGEFLAFRFDRVYIDRILFDRGCEMTRSLGRVTVAPHTGFMPGHLRWVVAGIIVIVWIAWGIK